MDDFEDFRLVLSSSDEDEDNPVRHFSVALTCIREKAVESPISSSPSADASISCDKMSIVEVGNANHLDQPSALGVNNYLGEKHTPSISYSKRFLSDISPEDPLDGAIKKRIVDHESSYQSVVEHLARDILKGAQLSDKDNLSSSSPALSKISSQSPSITSSTGPCSSSASSPPVGKYVERDSDSSDDDDGVVILEETGVDNIPSFRRPADVNITASNLVRETEPMGGQQRRSLPQPERDSEQKLIKKEDIPRLYSAPKELKQVEVECVAPYDEQKWVNIGKEKDGMKPEDVQYSQALKPPYHLASFLKMAGNSTKGISVTDKNTMVFVVMQGEVTVVLNTSQFVVGRGDSFFVPPHNTYNILNMKAREAELFLVQYKYEGSLLKAESGC